MHKRSSTNGGQVVETLISHHFPSREPFNVRACTRGTHHAPQKTHAHACTHWTFAQRLHTKTHTHDSVTWIAPATLEVYKCTFTRVKDVGCQCVPLLCLCAYTSQGEKCQTRDNSFKENKKEMWGGVTNNSFSLRLKPDKQHQLSRTDSGPGKGGWNCFFC